MHLPGHFQTTFHAAYQKYSTPPGKVKPFKGAGRVTTADLLKENEHQNLVFGDVFGCSPHFSKSARSTLILAVTTACTTRDISELLFIRLIKSIQLTLAK